MDNNVSPREYEAETMYPRGRYLLEPEWATRCRVPHEWNIPGAGETKLYCGCCGEKRPLGNLQAADLLSPAASASRWFRDAFARGRSTGRGTKRTEE